MPIHPDQRHRYPADWPAISARVREAAGHRCQDCQVLDRAWGFRDEEGAFHGLDKADLRTRLGLPETARPPFTVASPGGPTHILEIVLTVAHLNHRPEDNANENLRALCQRCHLGHDRPHHQALQARRRRAAMRTPELPLEIRA